MTGGKTFRKNKELISEMIRTNQPGLFTLQPLFWVSGRRVSGPVKC
jgi:hypothetical protein